MRFYGRPFENGNGYSHIDVDFEPNKMERSASMDLMDMVLMIKYACDDKRLEDIAKAREAVVQILSRAQ